MTHVTLRLSKLTVYNVINMLVWAGNPQGQSTFWGGNLPGRMCHVHEIQIQPDPDHHRCAHPAVLGNPAVGCLCAERRQAVKRQVNPQSGRVSFIGPENGRALSASRALGTFARPQDPARALADRFAPEFGLKDPARDLSEMKAVRSEDGRVTVRYQQEYNGVPVMGGELIVNTNERGDLYSMNGEVSADLALPTQPRIDLAQAAETALQAMAKWYQRAPDDFVSLRTRVVDLRRKPAATEHPSRGTGLAHGSDREG